MKIIATLDYLENNDKEKGTRLEQAHFCQFGVFCSCCCLFVAGIVYCRLVKSASVSGSHGQNLARTTSPGARFSRNILKDFTEE